MSRPYGCSREQLTKSGAMERLFERFDAVLRAAGYLAKALGDAIHALPCGAGQNLCLILRHLARRLLALFRLLAAPDPERAAALEPSSGPTGRRAGCLRETRSGRFGRPAH
jgi:hypothetical protein